MGKVTIYISCLLLVVSLKSIAQPGTSVDLQKPEKYEKRTLTSEKTGDKKFGFARRTMQNTFSHYNYYFNANTLLNDIVTEAKKSFKDDYTKMLPFYNYSLDITAGSGNLDSIIYKCNAGILLHDLRSNWVDNLYLILGKAYFYRKNFDSADHVFRYINYAFAPKESGGYDIPVGSNISGTNGTFSIATKENSSFPKKIITTPPSRNDAILWAARNFLEINKVTEAGGVLEILHNDPVFPERLQSELNELIAYWYYKQQVYDSAASHLVKALSVADSKLDKARMEFLAAQLYQLGNNREQSVAWYSKSAEHTTDPIMEVYANLNSIKASAGDTGNASAMLQEKINSLLKMAHRDKYATNRDIIYYAIAQAELERNDAATAQQMLKKSIYYKTEENPEQRSKSFLLLADINFEQQQYIPAKNFYDSIDASAITDEADKKRMAERQPALIIVAENLDAIHEQDSLQTVAALPKDQRDALIKKAVRYYRKQQGLTEESTELNVNPAIRDNGPADIFNTASKADWYFNNTALKGSGFNDFRIKWGNRPNTDNWRRQASINSQLAAEAEKEDDDSHDGEQQVIPSKQSKQALLKNEDGEVTFDALLENLPLTEEKLKASNNKIAEALFANGLAFQNMLEDYPAAINSYEALLKEYADNPNKEEALFNLYYCYNKIGRTNSADSVRNALNSNFPDGKMTGKLKNPAAAIKTAADPATAKYKEIYNLFLEGKFAAAKNEKSKADSIYGSSYWTPQLLYIESVFYVSQKEDSTAIDRLTNLNTLYPQSPLAEKAKTMIDVLTRRAEIEDYLTNLQITRNDKEDAAPVVDLTPVKPTVKKVVVTRDSVVNKNITQAAKTTVDSTTGQPATVRNFEFDAKVQQYVAIVLDKVDPVFINEAKNAFNRYNQVNFYNQKLALTPVKLNDRYNLVLIGPFADAAVAVAYIDKTKPVTGSRIVPWLTAEKYSYTIISQSNLDVLKETKDVDGYKQLLQKALPGQF